MEGADPPEAPEARSVPWGIGEPAIGFAAGFLGSSIAAVAWVAAAGTTDESLGLLVVSLVGLWTGYVLTIVLTSRSKGTGRITTDLGLRLEGIRDLIVGLAAGLASSFVVVPVVYEVLIRVGALDRQGLTDRLSDPAVRTSNLANGPWFFVLWMLIGVGAPIVEELFFRGFMQPALIKRLGPAAGLAITALIFGLAHFQPLQFPALAAFGAVLGFLAWRFGRLGPGIAAHMAFNTLTLIAQRLAR